MLSAIDDDNPVMYFENKVLMGVKARSTPLSPSPSARARSAARAGTYPS